MSSSERIAIPARTSASGTFGVTTWARGSSSRLIAVDRILVEQPIAALRDHHRIDDDVGKVELRDRGGDRFDDGRGGEHADLDGVGAEIGGDRFDLRRDEVGRQRLPGGHAERVLRRDRGDRRCAEDAVRGERLQVGLDAGAAARVAARNCQCCAHTVRFEPI